MCQMGHRESAHIRTNRILSHLSSHTRLIRYTEETRRGTSRIRLSQARDFRNKPQPSTGAMPVIKVATLTALHISKMKKPGKAKASSGQADGPSKGKPK